MTAVSRRVGHAIASLLVEWPFGEQLTQAKRRDGMSGPIAEQAPGAILVQLEAADERPRDVGVEKVLRRAGLGDGADPKPGRNAGSRTRDAEGVVRAELTVDEDPDPG